MRPRDTNWVSEAEARGAGEEPMVKVLSIPNAQGVARWLALALLAALLTLAVIKAQGTLWSGSAMASGVEGTSVSGQISAAISDTQESMSWVPMAPFLLSKMG